MTPTSTFKYVADPHRCAPALDDETACELCGRIDAPCYDGFCGDQDVDAVCLACIAAGLPPGIQQRRTGQPGLLREQLRRLHPRWSTAKITADIRRKGDELAHRTPPILSWQDWEWPACCGDYGRFLRHCGRPDLEALAVERRVSSGIELLRQGLIDPDEQPDIQDIWDDLPDQSLTPASNWSPQTYAFECLTCKRLLIAWDCH